MLEKSIQQGDILSHVLGKGKNGYVRGVGLGLSASSLGIPGAKNLKSTKLQMAQLEAAKACQANDALKNEIEEIRVDTKAQIDAMMQELDNMKRMISQSFAGNTTYVPNANNEIQIHPQVSVGDYSIPYDNSVHDVVTLVRKM